MRRALMLAAAMLAAGAGTIVVAERDAAACGGCFAPPENPTVVTDHRMILSISKEQSTLYDQIRYTGDPASFAWVLPVSGTVEVGLSADVVFGALDSLTQTQIQAPPRNCPPPPDDCFGSPASAGASPEDNGGVTVTKREVVGPYETVQLKATDPQALSNWLAQNNFSVPADIQPVIAQYVTEKFDFLALKLVPGKGIQDMRPVRVTTQGANAVLPLRMVAAGAGANVGISLWVLGEGRYEPQNFQSFVVRDDELVWDWNANKSNYVELRAQKTAAGNGRIWEIESSNILYPQNLGNAIKYGYFNPNGGPVPTDEESRAQQDYAPITDANGQVTKTAVQVRDEDLATLFHGIPTATSRVTRMRADLAYAALDADLVMTASADQATLSNFRQVTRESNQPLCPVWNGCDSAGQAPRDEAAARSTSSRESFSCSTSKGTTPTWLAIGAGFVGLAFVHAARRRRAR